MTSSRRIGAAGSVVRTRLLDAAEQLMLEEGYAAVSSRRLAAKAGMKQSLFYYYFRSMDELFLAVFRRIAEQSLAGLAKALESEQPIRALWDLNSDRSRTALTIEFAALANHRKVVQAEIARYAEQFRSLSLQGLTRLFKQRGIEPQIPPLIVDVLLTSVARMIVQEGALGISKGHAATHGFVEACLRHFEACGAAVPPLSATLGRPDAASREAPTTPQVRTVKRRHG